MGKLINLHKKTDPLEAWELQDKQKRKKHSAFSTLSLIEKEKEKTNNYKYNLLDTKETRLRRAEILAIQSEIQKSMLSSKPVIQVREDELYKKRQKEILNIKKTLQLAMGN